MGVIGELYDAIVVARKEGWLDRLIAQFKRKHRVIILGSTGTGKSQIRSSIWDMAEAAIESSIRTEFPIKERLEINANLFEFVDVPGQELHASRRLQAIREAVSSGLSGVINVVADGYHEYNIREISEAVKHDGSVDPEYLTKHRQAELNALNEWTSLLGSKDVASWLITVANKADLWWERRSEVLRYYATGAYFSGLGNAQSLGPVTVPYCATIHKFYNAGTVSGAFDDSERLVVRKRLFRALLEAIGKGHDRG